MTATEADDFSNIDVEVTDREAFPKGDVAEGEISLSEVVPNGDDTENGFTGFYR